jgi:hypothetical protein
MKKEMKSLARSSPAMQRCTANSHQRGVSAGVKGALGEIRANFSRVFVPAQIYFGLQARHTECNWLVF